MKKQRNKSLIQITKDTRRRFDYFRDEQADNHECSDNVFMNELLDFVEVEVRKREDLHNKPNT